MAKSHWPTSPPPWICLMAFRKPSEPAAFTTSCGSEFQELMRHSVTKSLPFFLSRITCGLTSLDDHKCWYYESVRRTLLSAHHAAFSKPQLCYFLIVFFSIHTTSFQLCSWPISHNAPWFMGQDANFGHETEFDHTFSPAPESFPFSPTP